MGYFKTGFFKIGYWKEGYWKEDEGGILPVESSPAKNAFNLLFLRLIPGWFKNPDRNKR